MNLKSVIKKQGGKDLIKRYWKGGAFWTALNQLLILGKSKTALEILRLSASLKIKNKLIKKYRRHIDTFDNSYKETSQEKSNSETVWICWLQGIENAPLVVKKCYASIKANLRSKEIILITEDNVFDYVSFPEHIIKKWKKGIISNTHLTDLLRLELLTKYGGTWIDATVLCTKSEELIPDYYFNSDLFFFQCLKPGKDGHCNYPSSWFISAKRNNKVLLLTKTLCYKYWESNNYLCDYFLLHQFLSISLDHYKDEWDNVVKKDNSDPHILLLDLFKPYRKTEWDRLRNEVPFHKLSYKFQEKDLIKEDTFYKKIIDKGQ